jgi:hypothetical protein
MKHSTASTWLAIAATCAALGTLATPSRAQATEQMAITNAKGAASAASDAGARRTLKFNTRHDVPATLTSHRDAPIASGWKAEVRFAGQTDRHECEFDAPKASQTVAAGETAVWTLRCTTPWQVFDNGLAFDAFEGGKKVASGTLRP